MECPKCHMNIKEGAKFCGQCGQTLGETAGSNLKEVPFTQVKTVNGFLKNKTIVSVITIITILAAILLCYSLSSRDVPSSITSESTPSNLIRTSMQNSIKSIPLVSDNETQASPTLTDRISNNDNSDSGINRNNPTEKPIDLKKPGEVYSWSIYASSHLKEKSIEHFPEKILDKKLDTAWVEGAAGDGINEWIILDAKEPVYFSGIMLINGYSKSSELYVKNSRVKKIRFEFSDGTLIEKFLNDGIIDYQVVNFEKTIASSYIKLTILEVFKGDKYPDTCISECRLF